MAAKCIIHRVAVVKLAFNNILYVTAPFFSRNVIVHKYKCNHGTLIRTNKIHLFTASLLQRTLHIITYWQVFSLLISLFFISHLKCKRNAMDFPSVVGLYICIYTYGSTLLVKTNSSEHTDTALSLCFFIVTYALTCCLVHYSQLNMNLVIGCKQKVASLYPIFSHFLLSYSLCYTHARAPAAGEPGRCFLMPLSVGSPGPHCHISLYYSCCSRQVQ